MSSLLPRHQAALGLDATLFYADPITVTRGEGVWLIDESGNRYLDLYNNVPCVGHANPRVVEAISQQAGTLQVHSRYLHEGVIAHAERLAGLHHDGLESTVITCSGTEANEVAVMAARAATGNQGVLVTDGTYHGNLADIGRMTRLPVGDARGAIRSFNTPDTLRPTDDPIDVLQQQMDVLRADGTGVAGLMICPIFANEGLTTPPDGFYDEACRLVRGAGGLVISDEVQAGFGRTGKWWGYETVGFEPDIVTMGKPMGNGMPVAGMISSHEIVSNFRRTHRYFNTFAASPMQAAASNAVIDEIEDRNLLELVTDIGSWLTQQLRSRDDDRIAEVRSHGLFIAVDWVHPGTTDPDPTGAMEIVEALKERFVLTMTDGMYDNLIKIRPPLVLEYSHAELFLETFTSVLDP